MQFKYESVILTIYTNRTHIQDNMVTKRTDRELDVINQGGSGIF